MKKRRIFLLWSLFASVLTVVIIVFAMKGIFTYIHRVDRTSISFIILPIFALATLWAGRLFWSLNEIYDAHGIAGSNDPEERRACLRAIRDDPDAQARLRDIDDRVSHVVLAEKLCPLLGLLGTVWGFIIMFGEKFETVLSGDANTVKEGLGQIASGISTAFVTTGIGILCGAVLLVQYYCIDYLIRRVRP